MNDEENPKERLLTKFNQSNHFTGFEVFLNLYAASYIDQTV